MPIGNSVQSYLNEISLVPLLTPEEEKDLALKAKHGDDIATSKLVTANLRFVVKIAKGYMNQGLSLEDLIQEGNLGLMEGIKRFDVDKGFRVTTYAGWWINLYIRRAIENLARPVRLPSNKQEILRKIGTFSTEFQNQHGRKPRADEIAPHVAMSPTKVEELLSYDVSSVSFDAPIREDGSGLESVLADPNTNRPEWEIYLDEVKKGLRKAMAVLSGREQAVIERRFGVNGNNSQPATLRQVAGEIGLSMEGVRRAEANALKKLQRPGVRSLIRSIISMMFVIWLSKIIS